MMQLDDRIGPADLAKALELASERAIGALRSNHYDAYRRACELLQMAATAAVLTHQNEAVAQRYVMRHAVAGLDDVGDILWSLDHPESPLATTLPKDGEGDS